MTSPPTVVFDLDGTLVDTAPLLLGLLLCNTLNYADVETEKKGATSDREDSHSRDPANGRVHG